jgi:predicted  nucleic acid-binding Zn-ribbon protein
LPPRNDCKQSFPDSKFIFHHLTVAEKYRSFFVAPKGGSHKLPVPHFNIKITQRSKGKSAVAGAAYQAGEKLFSEYDQKTKNYTCKKEVVYTEIMLPPNAPPEYADRAALWNSVEEIEKQWNSQLARRFVAALPREVPMELLPQMVKEYCEEHFVSKGMCCDFAIHDPYPPGHNPHCHFMLTMRAIDENGKWLPKSRKVYDLDENGERIKLPSGRWKSHKEDTVDWNEQYHAEEWRHGWEVVQNKYLELAGSPERIDMRSYERQGLDIIPTVHMGTAVSALERKGIATNIGNLNRDIKAANRMMNAIRSTIKNLRDWIADILEATKEVLAENEAEKKNVSPNLATLLRDYLNLRKAERSEWSRYGQQKGTTDDLKTISQATVYLQRHELFTLEDLDIALQGVSEKATAIREDMQKAANRMKAITAIQTAVADCEKHKAVHDKYIKIGWKIRKEAYVESHKDELTAFNKAYRILKKHGADLNVDLKALQKEYDGLRTTHADLKEQLAAVNEELKPMKDIRYWVSKVLSPEQTIEKQPEPKHSLKERLQYEQEQKKKEQVQKAPKQKKQDMEL